MVEFGQEKWTKKTTGVNNLRDGEQSFDRNYTFLTGRILGKYPFELNNGVTLFPVLGLEYSYNLDVKDKNLWKTSYKDELNDLFVDFGGGADFPLSSSIFLRTSVVAGINLTPMLSSEIKNDVVALGETYGDFGFQIDA